MRCGVELEQLLGHVAHRLLDARLGLFPCRAAQPIERRPRSAGVFLNQIEPFDRHEQLVVAVIAKLEEFLLTARADRRLCWCQLLQADELADPVIDMDDEVANLQIAQVREKRLREVAALLRRAALFLENVGLCVDLKRGIRQTESSRQACRQQRAPRRHGRVGMLDRNRDDVVLLQDLDRPLGAARDCPRRTARCRLARAPGAPR